MRKRIGFTLVEILVVLIVIAGLSIIAFNAYRGAVEKSKSAEALVASSAIRRGEEGYKLEKGTYVGAQSTEEINEILDVGIKPKYYEFQIIGADENNFTIIARRIQEDIDAGMVPDDQIMIAMDQTGKITTGGSQSWGGGTTGGGGGTTGGGGGTTGGGGGTTGGGGGTTGGGGGTTGGGGGTTGGGGGTTGGGGGTTGGGGGTTGGGGGTTGGGGGTTGGGGGYVSSITIEGALELLKGSSAGTYNYNLIVDNNIFVIFDDFTKYPVSDLTAAFWWGTVRNTIYINDEYKTGTSGEAIAALISHEATHADYEYNPQKWIDLTLLNHPELTEEDISIPGNSIDQEYNCFESQVQVWNEIKDGQADPNNNDAWAAYYAQGEADMKAMIRLSYGEDNLSEY